jgi:hypothetical protein
MSRLHAIGLLLVLVAAAQADDIVWVGPGDQHGDGSRQNPFSFSQALSGGTAAGLTPKPSSTVHLLSGTYRPTSPNRHGKEAVRALRPEVFRIEVRGEPDRPVTVMPEPGASVHLDGTLEIDGAHLRIANLEIGNADYVATESYAPAVSLWASRDVGIVNCNLFGSCSTVSAMAPSKNILIYGCLIHDSCGLPHGSSNTYLQNNADSTKTIEQCIAYRSSAQNLGVHVYFADAAHNVRFIDNIAFLGGCTELGRNWDNVFINPGVPFEGLELIGNVASQHETANGHRPNVRLSSKKESDKTGYTNGSGVVRDNWFMGGRYAVCMGRWKQLAFENNTLWAETLMMEINSATIPDAIDPQEGKPELSGYRIDGNRYFTTATAASFRHDRTAKLDAGDPLLTFAEWQALGLDPHGGLEKTANGRPTGSMVRVYANRYEKGRGNVAIFNWDGRDSVAVDLSKVLATGDVFRVYNCLEVTHTLTSAKPVLTGTYSGGNVAFPMKKDPTSPDFDAFLVLPGGKEHLDGSPSAAATGPTARVVPSAVRSLFH